MKEHQHDLVVIGSGPGGYVAAIRAAQLGLDTACVEKVSELGGTCLRVGCIPSKALLEASEKYHETKKSLKKIGIKVQGVELDLEGMLGHKDRTVKSLTQGVAFLLEKNKISRYQGHGRIEGGGAVVVEGDEPVRLRARNILIATGSDVATLPGIEMDGDRIGSSTEALSYPEVPEHLVIIGAGVIGLELGSVWRRLGSKVTVLEYLDHILFGIDLETAKMAQRLFKRQGLKFQLGARVTGARISGDQCVVEAEGLEPITCDRVLVAVGRRPYTENLGLETVGIELDRRGRIPVDEHFRSSERRRLRHRRRHRRVRCSPTRPRKRASPASSIIVTGYGHVNYDAIPNVVYTHPEIASVGKTEEELTEAGVALQRG